MDANGSPVPNAAQFHGHDPHRQSDPLPRYNGIERLKKRIGNYRQHHTVCGPRFNQSFSDACEQQSMETVVLHKRSLQHKAKKAPKKATKAPAHAAEPPSINVPAIKQELDFGHRLSPDFADLDQCAAALERDAATIGLNDSDTLNIIISELSDLDNVDFPDFKQEPGIESNWHKPQMNSLGGEQLGASKGQGNPAMSASLAPMNETLVPIQSIKQEPRSTLSMPFVRPPLPQSLPAQQVDLNRSVGGPRPFANQVNTVHFSSKNVMASGGPGSQFPIVPKQELLLAPHQQPLHMPHNVPFNKHQFAAMPMQNAANFMGHRPNAMRYPPHQPQHRQQPMMRAPLMRAQMANWTAMPDNTDMAMQPQPQVFMQQPCRPPFMHANTTNTDWRNSAMMPPQPSIHFQDNGNSLEFLENLAVGDASNFPAQDLLSSLDSVVTADDFDDILGTV